MKFDLRSYFLAFIFLSPVSMLLALTNEYSLLSENTAINYLALGSASLGDVDRFSMSNKNPAAIKNVEHLNAYAFQKFGIAGTSVTHLALGAARFDQKWALATSFFAPREFEEIDDFGNSKGAGSVHDFLVAAGWGNELVISKKDKTKGLKKYLNFLPSGIYAAGVNVKFYHSKIFEFSTSTVSFDTGLAYKTRINQLIFLPNNRPYNLSIGLSFLNIGPAIKYAEEAEGQPTSMNSAVKYLFYGRKYHAVSTLTGFELISGGRQLISTGFEYEFMSLIALRMAYTFGDPARSFSTGLGVRYSFNAIYDLELDYSFGIIRAASSEHSFGLSYSYNKGIFGRRVAKVKVESRNLDRKIDEEMISLLQNCVKEYEINHEKYPDKLDQVKPCVVRFGFSDIPKPMRGKYVYNAITGKVSYLEKAKSFSAKDYVALRDGSEIKGEFLAANSEAIVIRNQFGDMKIERRLIEYVQLSDIDTSDQTLLVELETLIQEIKANQGKLPGSLDEVNEYWEIKKGAKLPLIKRGELKYWADSGKISIVNNFPEKKQLEGLN